MAPLEHHDILLNDAQIGPYPVHLVQRVDEPTNRDGRDFAAWDGDLGWLHATVDEQQVRNETSGYVEPIECTDKWSRARPGRRRADRRERPQRAEDLPGVPGAAKLRTSG